MAQSKQKLKVKQNESESDALGPQFLTEIDEDTGEEFILVHGGTEWRVPWDY
jgi:hypothetical protein